MHINSQWKQKLEATNQQVSEHKGFQKLGSFLRRSMEGGKEIWARNLWCKFMDSYFLNALTLSIALTHYQKQNTTQTHEHIMNV
jgi:hypothetical protein